MLFGLFRSEKDQPEVEKIYGDRHRGMALNEVPGLFHFRGPVDIIKNKYSSRVCMSQAGLKIFQGGFLSMVPIKEYQVKRSWRWERLPGQDLINGAADQPDMVHLEGREYLFGFIRYRSTPFNGCNGCFWMGGRKIGGGNAQRCSKFKDVSRIEIFYQPEQ